MRILIASDKFKGSLSAREACEAIRRGLMAGAAAPLEIRTLPISDGGEGLARSLTDAKGGTWKTLEVQDAQGNPTVAGYGLSADGATGFIEMAEASGLEQLGSKKLDPWRASTYGTGELIRDAMDSGIRRLILGIGGSATNDGGVGMASALGFQFVDAAGNLLEHLPADLEQAVAIQSPNTIPGIPVTVACDVENPLLGPRGATRVYGPQKGIAEEDFSRHEKRLSHLCRLLGEEGAAAAGGPGAGAAGGLGFGCRVFLGATLESGFDLVARALDLAAEISWADFVVTGEGKIDSQSLEGKAPCGVARMARAVDKPVAAFCGRCEPPESDPQSLEETFGTIREIGKPGLSLEENLRNGATHLQESATALAQSW